MAEMILGSVVDSLAGHVLSLLYNEIGLTCCVKLDLKKLQSTLSVIRGVLQDAEKRQVDEPGLKNWLKVLKDLAYEADDLLDDFNTEAIRRKSVVGGCKKVVSEVSIFFSSSNQLIYANRMAHLIKGLNEKIDTLIKDSERFKLKSISENPSLVELHHNRPLTIPSDYERYVVGRDEDKKHVINFLLDPNFEDNLSILPIVGFGGMGKTTLARLVFKDDESLKDHFQQKIWVCVSTNFVVQDILRKLVDECSPESKKDEIARMEMNGLHDNLRAELGEKKFLLVLDDVWNENKSKWLELQNHLPYGAKGSKMLVTTRSSLVANTMAKTSHKLSGLPEKESLTLLMKMAGKEEAEWKNKNLAEIGKGILKKCGGVPLAIMTIGGLLSTRFSEREWSDLLEEDFSRIEQSDGDIMPTLKISYDFLPSHLKQCFTYCCLFPKDYKLNPNELVRLWMAQGFIFKSPGSSSSKTLHDVSKEYFKELVWRSFFQDIEKDRAGNITGCKMHDLMHDLGTKVAGGSYTTIINSSSASREEILEEVRHVSMVDMGDDRGSYNLKSLGPNQGIIRSLLTIDHYHRQVKALGGDISSFRNLRALRLHSVGIKNVPHSIGKLKHLRSLDLSWSGELTSLPNSIGKLLNLEMLILYGCKKLESLPREVTKLVNLRHLIMEGCGSLKHMPRGMGNLTNLEMLRGFLVEKSTISNVARMNELVKLTGLEELSIEYLGRVKELDSISTSDADSTAHFWIDKSRLQSLHLSWEPWGWEPRGWGWGRRGADDPSEYAEEVLERLKPNLDLLKSFTIEKYPGTRLPSWTSLLHNLVDITIEGCDHMRNIPPLYQLCSLESICLSRCYNIRSIPPLDQPPSLKRISLHDMEKLEWIEVTENSICLYPSLEGVSLSILPMFKGWKRKMMDVNRSGDQTIHSSSSLFFIPSFSRKVHALIYSCEMLCCTWNDKKGLSLQVGGMKYKNLEEELWRRNVEEEEMVVTQMGSLTFVPLSSVPLQTLTSLTLGHLDDTEHLPMELFQSLSRLQSLELLNCNNIRSIPPLDQLSSLETIKLSHCKNIRSIPPLDQLSSLETIELSHCKNIRSIPPLDQLSSLETIKLSHCKNIRSIPPLDQIPSLKSISFTFLEKLEWIEVTENCICLYPSLEGVLLDRLPMFKGWKRKRMDGNRSGDQSIHSSSSSFLILSFYRKVQVQIEGCRMLSCMWDDNEWVLLQLARMKYKDLEELWKRNRRNVEEEEMVITQMGSLPFVPLSSVPLQTLTSLSMHYLEDTEELPMELFHSLSHLQSLNITECHHMRRIPPLDQLSWLKSIKLSDCNNIRSIPPLDQLRSLKRISLYDMEKLEWIEVTENGICLYLSLEEVSIRNLPMFKGWKRMRMDGNRSGDQTIHSSSSSLFFIPSFSRKVHVEKYMCGMLCFTYNDKKGLSLQVGGMKYKNLEEELCRRNRRNRRNVEEEEEEMAVTQMGSLKFVPLSFVPLHMLTSLYLINLEDTEELPSKLYRSLSRLQTLGISYCHRLKSLSGWAILPYLVSLEYLIIDNCKELDLSSMDHEEDKKAIQGIPNYQSKITWLLLAGMDKMKTLPPWIQYLPKLGFLILDDCKNMETLPGWFSQITSLKRLKVVNCGELSRKCQRDVGEFWPQISHIGDVDILHTIAYEEEAADSEE